MHISSKCSIAVHILLFIHEYSAETKVTGELLSLSTGCNPVTVRGIMSALKKGGMLTVRPGTGGAALSCPPEQISLYRICMAVEPDAIQKLMGTHSTPSRFCPVGRSIHHVLDSQYDKLRQDVAENMKSICLTDFLAEYHAGQPQRKQV